MFKQPSDAASVKYLTQTMAGRINFNDSDRRLTKGEAVSTGISLLNEPPKFFRSNTPNISRHGNTVTQITNLLSGSPENMTALPKPSVTSHAAISHLNLVFPKTTS